MDDFEESPEDLEDVEVIYSDGEGEYEESVEDMIDDMGENEIETDVIDLAKLTFTKHTKSVFSSTLSSDSKIAVTGGEDDMAYVWDTTIGEVIFECTGHKDSVTEVAFNRDDQYLATADMGGMVQVWSIKEKKLIWCYEGEDMEWLCWHPLANILLSGYQSGAIYIWQIPQGNCKVIPSPTNCSCTCGKVLSNGKQLLAAYEDGQLKLWNIKEITAAWSTMLPSAIANFTLNPDESLVITAPSSHLIKMADGKIVATFQVEGESEIEAAEFNTELGVLVTGAISGQLCVWDLARQSIRHQAKIECAVTILKWGLNGKLFVGATDGAVYVCDIKSGTLIETLTGHRSDILSISVFKDFSKILTTSDDKTAKIFEIKP